MIDRGVLPPFSPLSLDQLFELDLPETEFLVEGMLPQGDACLLSSREKAGKGLITIDLCAAIAMGEPFLDQAVLEGGAIYCAAEEHVRDVRNRIAVRIGDRREIPFLVLPLDGSTDDHLQLNDPYEMQRLMNMVTEHQPRLVVLDTLRELHNCQEDRSDEMGPLLRPVRQLTHQTNTTVIVNHHQNRGGTFRGSTAIRAAFDLEWAFTRTDSDTSQDATPRGTLRVEGRHGPRSIHPMHLGQGLRWVPDDAVPFLRDLGARERIIADLVSSNLWLTADDLARRTGIAKKTVQNLIAELIREQPSVVAVEGTGNRNDARRYHALTPRLAGVGNGTSAEMIPPDGSPIGGKVGGNQFPTDGTAGDDRYTR